MVGGDGDGMFFRCEVGILVSVGMVLSCFLTVSLRAGFATLLIGVSVYCDSFVCELLGQGVVLSTETPRGAIVWVVMWVTYDYLH